MNLPNINISFVKKAVSAIERSAKGIVCLVVLDATKTVKLAEYKELDEVDVADFTAENYKAISDAFHDRPTKVYVVRIGAGKTFADAKATLDTLKFNWLTCITDSDQNAVVTYVKARNEADKVRKIKAVVHNATTPDDMHVVNFVNAKVTYSGGTEIDGYKFLGRLTGMLAALPFTRSATYYEFADLLSVVEPADVNDAINKGGLVLINDFGEPKVGRAVNSLQTLSATVSEDMKKITVVEGMDLIQEDIATEFKQNYVGKYKNKYDNQCIFISAVNSYFRQLQREEVLDDQFESVAEVDVETQRAAWVDSGKAEASAWQDGYVKKMTYRSNMYLTGSVKILDALEDLDFTINLA